jgi:hypothetical protein
MQHPPTPCHRLGRREAQPTARVVAAGRASSLVLVFFSLLICFLSFLVLATTKWHGIKPNPHGRLIYYGGIHGNAVGLPLHGWSPAPFLHACSRQALSPVVLVMGVIRYTD